MSPKRPVGIVPPPTLPPLGDVLEFLRLIWAVDHALQRVSKTMERTLGITAPQRLVILVVGRFPGVLAGQVAEILHLHPSTVTGILKRLERERLVMRRSDPRDRRRAMLGLTAKGQRLRERTSGTVEAAIRGALSELSPPAARQTRDVLRRIAIRLEEQARHLGASSRARVPRTRGQGVEPPPCGASVQRRTTA